MKIFNIIDTHSEYMDFINNKPTNEFIEFAKKYNIFQDSKSKYVQHICNCIKERLDREGLSYDIVRPE